MVNVNDIEMSLQVWDTPGNEFSRDLTRNLYKNNFGAIIVVDLSNKKSLQDAEYWIKDIRSSMSNKVPMILACNKCDRNSVRVLQVLDVVNFATVNNIKYIEVSTRTDYNVLSLFNLVAKEIIKTYFPFLKTERDKKQKKGFFSGFLCSCSSFEA